MVSKALTVHCTKNEKRKKATVASNTIKQENEEIKRRHQGHIDCFFVFKIKIKKKKPNH